MKISDAIALRHDGSIPGTSYDYHVVVVMEEEIEISETESVKRPSECLLRWWPDSIDPDAEAFERRFELDYSGGREAAPKVSWKAGTDDPSGKVAEFMNEAWAPELP